MIWFIILSIAIVFLLTAMGGILVVADPLQKADAIVVLSGGDEHRIDEAIRLYQEEYADTIILTETGAFLEEFNAEYSKERQLVLLNAGIPGGAIMITPWNAASTRDEAKDVKALLQSKHPKVLLVVTDPYHTLRTRMIWEEVFEGTETEILVRPVRDSWYSSSTWWLSKAGWKNTVNEYIKLFGYIIQHKVD
ncbi:MAG: YdcF family protein [Leptolinea sp.]|nr:YdcF family protein [Leptolinea sp.]